MSMKELLKEQEQIGLKINNIVINAKKDGPSRRTTRYVEERKKILKDVFDQACLNHEKLNKESSIKDHQYFTTNYYEQIKMSYEEAIQYFENWDLDRKLEQQEGEEKQNSEVQKQKYRIQQLSRRIGHIMQATATNEADWQIESLVQAAQRQWDIIEEADVNISIYGTSSNDNYYSENLFEEIQSKFENAKKEANKRINRSINQANVKSTMMLPKITIPRFYGNYEAWPSFRDLFEKIIHENRTISGTEKMQYLKTHVKGEAERLIKHLNVTEENYESAWNLLQKRYQNERLIINKYVDNILDLPTLERPMTQDLKNMYNTVNEALVALKNLGLEVDTWGPILSRIVTKKWDKSTRKINEMSLDNPHRQQQFSEIMEFMEKRIKSLEITSRQMGERSSGQQTEYNKYKEKSKLEYKTFNKNRSMATCAMCNGVSHRIFNCTLFKMLDVASRWRIVNEKRVCHCCLGHESRLPCRSTNNCDVCKRRHHTLLHKGNTPAVDKKGGAEIDHKPKRTKSFRTYNSQEIVGNQVPALLPTAIVQITTASGEPRLFRALCDQGSEVSFCTEEVAQILGYPKQKITAKISGIGSNQTKEANKMIDATMTRRNSNGFKIEVPLIILPKLTSPLPYRNISELGINKRKEDLADPTYNIKGCIDILLGAGEYSKILLPGLRKIRNGVIAQNTQFGWIVSGNITDNANKAITLVSMVSRKDEQDRLSKFWEMEEINIREDDQKEEDVTCEEFYKKTTRRNKDGSYTVKIPFKTNSMGAEKQLGESRPKAAARLWQLERRFKKDEKLHKQYNEFMADYQRLNHMKKVPKNEENSGKYYIPHQPVIKEDSITTKLRVVFDASSKTSSLESLNDIMHKGPRLQEDLPSILLRWRKHKICFMADIEKMYRCIKVADSDQKYQRILWRFVSEGNPNDKSNIEEYQLTTVTYGTSAAPYLAIRTLLQLAIDEARNFPEASRVTMEDFYVDDCLSGGDDINSARNLQHQLIQMLKSGQFKLRKWASNTTTLIDNLPQENRDGQLLQLPHDETRKSLGVLWAPHGDYFTFKISVKENNDPSKRFILSEVSKIFDPLGWLGPIILNMKLLIQQLWIKKVGWDTPLNETYKIQWEEFQKQIRDVEKIKIPRWLGCVKETLIELHGFCDASEKAYGAVVYSRAKTSIGYSVVILQAKSKVAPIKHKTTLPRLELSAALLLARLLKKITGSLKCDRIELNMWSDSMITLGWIKGEPERWNKFVGTRVSEIRNLTPPQRWNYVKSSENPADIISRGSDPKSLQENKLWWEGPAWLKQQEIKIKEIIINTCEEEVRSHLAQCEHKQNIWERFSDLQHMLRVLTYCRRIAIKNKPEKSLQVVEIQETLHKILRIIQQNEFKNEYERLLKNEIVNKKSRLSALDPFLDKEGLIRVGGRLSNSTLSYNQKHPIILPYKHHVTDLIIRNAHKETLHGGNQATLSYIRSKFWILGAMRRIKATLNKCVKCIRHKGISSSQKMGQLPGARVTPSHPFSSSGVDYAGPIQVRATKGRGHKAYKGYIALFVCLATKAIHLELVSDMTTTTFLAAFRRFTARRGHCYHLYSDNGTYFVKAAKSLQDEVLEITQKPDFQDKITNMGTQWHFIPTHSPHFGGLWERGVRSMKHHLRRTIGDTTLTFEELTTLLCQIEACLNSRPLCNISGNTDNIQALTPSHFLIGREAVGIPDPIEQCTELETTLRWKIIQKIKKDFWKKWTSDYLNQLQQRYKWKKQGPEIKIGDIVLIKDENLSPSKWPLAKVVDHHPGIDRITRVITIQKANGVRSKRSIHSIVPMEISESPDSGTSPNNDQDQKNMRANINMKKKRSLKVHNGISNPFMWLTLMTTIMCLLPSVSGNHTIKRLDEGFCIEELGDVKIDRGIFRIDVAYPKAELKQEWQNVINIMEEFQRFCSSMVKTTAEPRCSKLYQHLEERKNQFKQVKDTLLYLHNIKKRGLLGNIMTSVFGVNDEVYRDISVLQDNQNKLREAADHQTNFMMSAMAGLNETKTAIFNKIERFRVKLNEAVNYVNKINAWQKTVEDNKVELHILETYQMATNVIEEINDQYKKILEVYMNKASIYDAISPVDVTQTIKKANELMPHKLRIMQKPLIDSKIIENTTHILIYGYFSIQDTSTYVLMNISPVPKKQSNEVFEVINIQDTLIAVDYNSEYYFEMSKEQWDACVTLGNRQFLCQPRTISKMQVNKNCIINELFKQNSTNICPTVRTKITRVIWKPLYMANTWMFITNKPNRISIICDGEREEILIKEAGILQVGQKCIIKTEENILITRRSKSVPVKAVFSKKSNFVLKPNSEMGKYKDFIAKEEVLTESNNWVQKLMGNQQEIQHELQTPVWKQIAKHPATISMSTISIFTMLALGGYCLLKKASYQWRPRQTTNRIRQKKSGNGKTNPTQTTEQPAAAPRRPRAVIENPSTTPSSPSLEPPYASIRLETLRSTLASGDSPECSHE